MLFCNLLVIVVSSVIMSATPAFAANGINTIKEIGPDRCIIGSDFGQVLHMDSIDGMRVFIRALLGFGIREKDVKTMLQDNPAKLMWLDAKTTDFAKVYNEAPAKMPSNGTAK